MLNGQDVWGKLYIKRQKGQDVKWARCLWVKRSMDKGSRRQDIERSRGEKGKM